MEQFGSLGETHMRLCLHLYRVEKVVTLLLPNIGKIDSL